MKNVAERIRAIQNKTLGELQDKDFWRQCDQFIRKGDSIGLLKGDVTGLPRLTVCERYQLDQGMEAGDKIARGLAVAYVIPMVIGLANRYQRDGYSKEDLVGDGNEGLAQELNRFDSKRGAKFSTFAYYRVVQKMLMGLKNNGRSIRLPAGIYPALEVTQDIFDKKKRELGHTPSEEDLFEDIKLEMKNRGLDKTKGMKVNSKNIKRWLETIQMTEISLDELYEQTGGVETISDGGLGEKQFKEIELDDQRGEIRETFARILQSDVLSKKQSRALGFKVGSDDHWEVRTNDEVGELMGISHEGARLLLVNATKRLRSNSDFMDLREMLQAVV